MTTKKTKAEEQEAPEETKAEATEQPTDVAQPETGGDGGTASSDAELAAFAALNTPPTDEEAGPWAKFSMAASFRVIALQAFGDARPTRSYNPGDEVRGWTRERAEHYAAQGLVEIVEG